MVDLSKRTVLVTGASGGLGPAVVDAFLASGAKVLGVSRSGNLARESDRFRAFAADLTRREGAEAAVAETVAFGGSLDVIAHAMGGFAGGSPVQQTDDETWERMMADNLLGAFFTFRAALPKMLENQWGRIVAVSSKNALEPAAGLSAYNVSKAGLDALIQTIAQESGEKGVTANAILTTIIDTPANRQAMPKADFSRWVSPEALAQQIVWLSSEEAADINGALVPVYGRAG